MNEPRSAAINDVRRAVHDALAECFPDVPVLDGEAAEQEAVNPPCFIVRLLESVHEQELDRRYMRRYPFNIQCVDPDAGDDDRYDAADKLSDALQWIEAAGRPVRGTGMKFEIKDQILHRLEDPVLEQPRRVQGRQRQAHPVLARRHRSQRHMGSVRRQTRGREGCFSCV